MLKGWAVPTESQTGLSSSSYSWILDEMQKEHPGWNTAHKQEWGLFLFE